MPRGLIGILILALILGSLPASGARAASDGEAALTAYLEQYPTQVAYHAIRLSDGAVLATRDARTAMVPASVQKLCTSAIALATLGPDFHFRTRLAVSGNRVLIIGDGDPVFGDPVLAAAEGRDIYHTLDAWAAALKARGMTSVADVIVDDDIFQERRHRDWPKSQHQRWYCAPVSGLNYNDNCLDIQIRRTAEGPEVEVSPVSNRMRIVNRLTLGPKHVWGAVYEDHDGVVTLRGTIAKSMDSPLSVAVNEPSVLLGRVFADRLAAAGLPPSGAIMRRRVARGDRSLPDAVTVVAEHATPLALALRRANKRSLGLAAECLLLRSAVARRGPGTYAAATAVGQEVLTGVYGLEADQFTIADGSGLSRNNRLSAAAAATLLERLATRPDAPMLIDSLPIAAVDGTLAKRLTHLRGRVRAKTGTLDGVVALAGYITDEQGRPIIAMAVLCNQVRGGNWRARPIIDALVTDWADGE